MYAMSKILFGKKGRIYSNSVSKSKAEEMISNGFGVSSGYCSKECFKEYLIKISGLNKGGIERLLSNFNE
jgi:uncharacterized protein (DUF697 family)